MFHAEFFTIESLDHILLTIHNMIQNWLTNEFGRGWLVRFASTEFPPPSPNLTPIDFF